METPPAVPTGRTNSHLADNIIENENHSHGTPSSIFTVPHPTERVVTPIQPLIQPRTNIQQRYTAGSTVPAGPVNPTFAILKVTTIQHAIGYPLVYVRALMQMGYEPMAAVRGTNMFGKEALYYPNVFRYFKYIYNSDGVIGLYRGFGCSLLSKFVSWYTATKVDELFGPMDDNASGVVKRLTWNDCLRKILREIQCQSWGILVSHPFQVMALRSMAQFIGRERFYSSINIFQNFKEIYDRQGIGGFFAGLIPRWLLEISMVIITNVIIHALKTQIPSQNDMISIYEYFATFVAQTLTYPLSVVTTVTAVNRCGLRAGTLPITPIFANWQDAYNYLSKTEQLKRGSSLFNRVAFGASGVPMPGTPVPNA